MVPWKTQGIRELENKHRHKNIKLKYCFCFLCVCPWDGVSLHKCNGCCERGNGLNSRSTYPEELFVEFLKSDRLEKLPTTREAGRKRDIKLQENTETELLANVSHRDNPQKDDMCQISEVHSDQIHNKICSHTRWQKEKPWMLLIVLRLITKQ